MNDKTGTKAVIVDLDNTLLHSDKTLSARTLAALHKCRKKGIQIMAATARPQRAVQPYHNAIAFDAMAVSNGARILSGENQIEHALPPVSTQRLLAFLQYHSALRITLETGDCAYSNKPIEDYATILANDLAVIAHAESALKILVHIDDQAMLSAIKNALAEDLYCTIANGRLLQIMSKTATKWNGVRTMLAVENIAPHEAVYFGDDHDDVEPLRMCGTGVAVANGIAPAKAAADYITDSNDDDGVAAFIEQFILSK